MTIDVAPAFAATGGFPSRAYHEPRYVSSSLHGSPRPRLHDVSILRSTLACMRDADALREGIVASVTAGLESQRNTDHQYRRRWCTEVRVLPDPQRVAPE